MYQNLGATVHDRTVTFKVFVPDATRDPRQYRGVADPHIDEIRVVGDFQSALNGIDWDVAGAPVLERADHPSGFVYAVELPELPDNWYQYKYVITFHGGQKRWITDPCTKHVSRDHGNGGFVIGGAKVDVRPLAKPHRLADEILYELAPDDFTAGYRQGRPPLDAIIDRLGYLKSLGITGIQFLPWTVWPGPDYNWGYEVALHFAVEERLVLDRGEVLDRNYRLARLIDECHQRDLSVYMDGVFNQVQAGTSPEQGFPYKWMYHNPAESPFLGPFQGNLFLDDLQYDNGCVQQYIYDVCRYWLDTFQIDGIRFDYSLGFLRENDVTVGLGRLIPDLHDNLNAAGRTDVALVLEYLSEPRYLAIDQVNRIGADGAWQDPFGWAVTAAAQNGTTPGSMVRDLDTAEGFTNGGSPVIYMENHDHGSTINKMPGKRAEWWRTQPAAVALFTCAGGVLLRNGQEFGQDIFIPETGDDRVAPRPLDWSLRDDEIGQRLLDLYRRLAQIRISHPALRHGEFWPSQYDWSWDGFAPDGYGVDTDLGLALFARRNSAETVVVALNFSGADRDAKVPFPHHGTWRELLNGADVEADSERMPVRIPSHWARIYADTRGRS
jgi:pullulanase